MSRRLHDKYEGRRCWCTIFDNVKAKRWQRKHNHSSSVRRCREHCGLARGCSVCVFQRLWLRVRAELGKRIKEIPINNSNRWTLFYISTLCLVSHCVCSSTPSRCADAHDFVYAPIPLHEAASAKIIPDYTKPLPRMYSETAKCIIKEQRSGKHVKGNCDVIAKLCSALRGHHRIVRKQIHVLQCKLTREVSDNRKEVKEVSKYLRNICGG